MRRLLLTLLTPLLCTIPMAASAQSAADAAPPWNPAQMGRTIEAARQARGQGDLMAAERLCVSAFESVDQGALAAYDAYADRLQAGHRAEETAVREQSVRLHALKADQRHATEPTSTYVGFAPADGLKAYADLLASAQEAEEARRVRALALAYQQVQQAQFQRTMLFRQGQDPRGSC